MDSRPAAPVLAGAKWLLCRAGSHACGLPVEAVALTMRRPDLDVWSGPEAGALGVATVRGEAVPVVSLGRLLRGVEGDEPRLVVLALGKRRVALSVEQVVGVRALDPSTLSELPPLLRDAHAEHVAHLGRLDGELLLLLGTARLLPDERAAAQDSPVAAP